jgi:hypothetical protein
MVYGLWCLMPLLVVIDTDCTGSCKSNYHTITTMTAPIEFYYIRYDVKIQKSYIWWNSFFLTLNKRERKWKGQSRMGNPETLATLGAQDTGQRQSRDTGNTWIVFVLCLVLPVLPVSLDCLCPVSCAPSVASVSGLSLSDTSHVKVVDVNEQKLKSVLNLSKDL